MRKFKPSLNTQGRVERLCGSHLHGQDLEDGFCTGCLNTSRQQSFSGFQSPRLSFWIEAPTPLKKSNKFKYPMYLNERTQEIAEIISKSSQVLMCLLILYLESSIGIWVIRLTGMKRMHSLRLQARTNQVASSFTNFDLWRKLSKLQVEGESWLWWYG